MTEDAFVLNLPTGVGALGKDKVRGFYTDIFIGTLPDDWDSELKNRVVGESALERYPVKLVDIRRLGSSFRIPAVGSS